MSLRSIATLRGFLRFHKLPDAIGVPVFHDAGMNFDLIAEADADLRITRFMELFPEEGYEIEAFPFRSELRRRYSIGDPTPIPFVCAGLPQIISGDRHASDLNTIQTRTPESAAVISDLSRLLTDAREGVFRRRNERWKVDEVRTNFPEVFEERPSNSRYWVSRYRVAIAQSKNADTSSRSLDDEFRRLGTRWLSLFATKTDFPRMRLLFGDANDGVFSRDDVVAATYGFFCHKYADRKYQALERIARQDGYFLGLLPGGLFYHERRHDLSHFKYSRPADFLEEIKIRLYRSIDSHKVEKTAGLALILFGLRDSPNDLRDILGVLRSQFTRLYREGKDALDDSWNSIVNFNDIALATVRAYDSLVELERVEYGNARLRPRPNDYLAHDKEFMDELRQVGADGT